MARDISFLSDDDPHRERESNANPPNGVSDGGFHVPEPPPAKTPASPPLPPPPAPVSPPPTAVPIVTPAPPRRNGARTRGNGGSTDGASNDRPTVPTPDRPPVVPVPNETRRAELTPRKLRRISLLPPELEGTRDERRWVPVTAIAGMGVALLLIVVPWALLRSAVTRERHAAEVIDRDAAIIERELEDAATALRAHEGRVRRASAAVALLDRHLTWAGVFPLIESRTLPGVVYESFATDANGSIALSAMAPNIRAVAEQIAAWRGAPFVRRVDASNAASTVDEVGVTRAVRFDLRITVDPTLFSQTGNVSGTTSGTAIAPPPPPAGSETGSVP